MYPNLKLQIWRLGVRQNRLAQMIGIHETLLSKIVNGFRQPDAECRIRIAQALQMDEGWLFASNDSVVERPNSPLPVEPRKAKQGERLRVRARAKSSDAERPVP